MSCFANVCKNERKRTKRRIVSSCVSKKRKEKTKAERNKNTKTKKGNLGAGPKPGDVTARRFRTCQCIGEADCVWASSLSVKRRGPPPVFARMAKAPFLRGMPTADGLKIIETDLRLHFEAVWSVGSTANCPTALPNMKPFWPGNVNTRLPESFAASSVVAQSKLHPHLQRADFCRLRS